MLRLCLTSSAEAPDRFRVELALEGEGFPRQTASTSVELEPSPQDEEGLRWYLEDYLQWPRDPAPEIAARIEQRLAEIGSALFEKIFQANDDARGLWASVQPRLEETRVEVIAAAVETARLPWELLRDPRSDVVLALRARSFVRTQSGAAQAPRPPEGQSRPLRILFVMCRPGAGDAAPFRSVAARIVKGLDTAASQACELEVLRPATFEALGERLRSAQLDGRPFHVVHFDGHASLADLEPLFAAWQESPDAARFVQLLEQVAGLERESFSPQEIYPGEPAEGAQAYLHFESSRSSGNPRLVEGAELGRLLVETEVPVLLLAACCSAHVEAPTSPQEQASAPHSQARAWDGLAQEVMNAGVAGVLVMRFNVYVVTAAQFVADLYGALTCGRTLAEAVTLGRRQLESEPLRSLAHAPLPLQDWLVPLLYEAAPVRLFAEAREEPALALRIEAGTATAVQQALDEALPPTPEVGFFGRDETLLAGGEIVLLHAYAGGGKTATASEFARWYALTGGLQGPVLFMSFEQHLPLPRLLDRLGAVFARGLEAQGIHWLSLSDPERSDVALQILEQIPLLWVWDNVEPVTGFPVGSESAWSAEEQGELVGFLRAAQGSRARFLLTSRREEQEWLGDLPRRIALPALPMQELQQLARALAEKRDRKLGEVGDWGPLLRFAQGNPLTLTVLVEQVLREGLRTEEQVRAFVELLRRDEASFGDAAHQGRAGSLGASLH